GLWTYCSLFPAYCSLPHSALHNPFHRASPCAMLCRPFRALNALLSAPCSLFTPALRTQQFLSQGFTLCYVVPPFQGFERTVHCSLLPVHCSLFPVPCSLLPAPCSLLPVPSPSHLFSNSHLYLFLGFTV